MSRMYSYTLYSYTNVCDVRFVFLRIDRHTRFLWNIFLLERLLVFLPVICYFKWKCLFRTRNNVNHIYNIARKIKLPVILSTNILVKHYLWLIFEKVLGERMSQHKPLSPSVYCSLDVSFSYLEIPLIWLLVSKNKIFCFLHKV